MHEWRRRGSGHSCIRGAAGIRGWLPAELAAVRSQIERTDRLIDHVVYRLYLLTEEEIAVVERSG